MFVVCVRSLWLVLHVVNLLGRGCQDRVFVAVPILAICALLYRTAIL